MVRLRWYLESKKYHGSESEPRVIRMPKRRAVESSIGGSLKPVGVTGSEIYPRKSIPYEGTTWGISILLVSSTQHDFSIALEL